jgi:hypothetical protein
MLTSSDNKILQIRSLVFFSFFLCTASCEKKELSYFPLYAGLNWQYDIEKQTVIGDFRQREIINNRGRNDSNDDVTFVRASINGIESHYTQSSNGIYLKYRSTADGAQVTNNNIASIVFNYPLIVGAEWQDSLTTSLLKSYDNRARDVIEAIPVTVTIESINDVVRVPAGKYSNCIRIITSGEKYIQKGKYAYQPDMNIKIVNTRWYAAGVGLVKELQVESSDVLQYPEGNFVKMLTKFY